MKTFEKFYTIFYLLFGWFAIRFLLFSAHGMKQWPDLLAVIGGIIVLLSTMGKRHALARMASLGYVVSFLFAYLLRKDGTDAGGGMTNSIRIIWTIAYFALIAFGVFVESKRRAQQTK